jgi:hypothetical protein
LDTHPELNDRPAAGWLNVMLYSIAAFVVGFSLPVALIVFAAGGAKLNDVRFDSPEAIARSLDAPLEACLLCGLVLASGTLLRFSMQQRRWLRLIIYSGIIALVSIAVTRLFFASIGHPTPIKGYDSLRFLRLGMSLAMFVCGVVVLGMFLNRFKHRGKPSPYCDEIAG